MYTKNISRGTAQGQLRSLKDTIGKTDPKSTIRIQGVDAAPSHVCNSTPLKDDGGFYTYTPIDGNFKEVADGSADHVYYGVDFRTHILNEIRNRRWPREEKAPDTGLTYRGKPVVSLAHSFSKATTTAIVGTVSSGKP